MANDMLEGETSIGLRAARLRKRLVLEVVAAEDAKGFVLPQYQEGSLPYRGRGPCDYVCGCCGHLLAIGVSQGMFKNLVFACSCGACNKVS